MPSSENYFDQLLFAQHFFAFGRRPAKQRQKVAKRRRHKTSIAISRQRNNFAVFAFRELAFVWRENQRQVRKLRHRRAERLVKQDLLVSVREMVLAANHVRDAHLDVVDHDREVVKRMAVGTQQHEIFDLGVAALLRSVNDVVKLRLAFARQLSNAPRTARPRRRAIRFFFRQIAKRIAALVHAFGRLRARAFGDVLLYSRCRRAVLSA